MIIYVLHLISDKIKKLRQKRGLTLQQAAELAGTSATALHRYENGWERFDTRTLAKIVQGLGGELQIDIKERRRPKKIHRRSEIYRVLKPLFWDVPVSQKRLKEHLDWLTLRVLELGNLDQVRALLSFFTRAEVCDSFRRQQHKFSRKTQSAWSGYFNLKDSSCTLKSYQKEPVRFMNS